MTRTGPLADVLRRQHGHMHELVGCVMEVGGPARSNALREMVHYVALHEAAERTFMHASGLLNVEAAATARHRLDEEDEIAALITHIEGVADDSLDFAIYFSLLEESLAGHGRAEEEVEVPALGAMLSQPELDRLADAMSLVDSWSELSRRITAGTPSGADPPFAGLMPVTAGPVRGAAPPSPTYVEQHRRGVSAFEAVVRAL